MAALPQAEGEALAVVELFCGPASKIPLYPLKTKDIERRGWDSNSPELAPVDHSLDWTSTTKEAFMRTSLVAEKASGQRLRQRSAQLRGFRWWKHRAWGAVAQAEHHPMAKSNPVDETRIAEPVNPIKPQPFVNLKKARRIAKAQKRRTRSNAVGSRHCAKPASGKQTKQQTCLDLLGRREGATIEDFEQATGWQKHSVRGFLAGAVKKKLGLALISEKPDAGPRRYRIPTKA